MPTAKNAANRKPPTLDKRGRCGTGRGYTAHRTRGEYACADCRAAHSERTKAYQQGRKPPRDRKPAVSQEKAVDTAVIQADPAPQPAPAPDPQPEPAPKPKPKAATGYKGVPDDCPPPPNFLKKAGLSFWIEVTQGENYSPGSLVLIGEACRSVDRLERISAALASRNTFWFEVGDIEKATDAGVPIVVNGMIGEARQLQNSIRQTLNAVQLLGRAKEKDKKSALDMIAEQRQKRMEQAG